MSEQEHKKLKFEVAKPSFNFDCDFAVYSVGCDKSICYCTDKRLADVIVKALSATSFFDKMIENGDVD